MAGNEARVRINEGEKRGSEQDLTADPAACSVGSWKDVWRQGIDGDLGRPAMKKRPVTVF